MRAKSTTTSSRISEEKSSSSLRFAAQQAMKPAALACAISTALIPLSASAELRELGAYEMSEIRGQAGLTIDIETKMTIGEIEYVDEGSLFQRDISLGGIDGGFLDNLRARLDVSNGNETLLAGFAEYARYANLGFLDASETDIAWALAEYDDGVGGLGRQVGDGDLFIHVSALEPGFDLFSTPNPADFQSNLDALKNAVDLKFETGAFGLRSTDGLVETEFTRNFSVEAYLGYLDILITNNGNGFSATNDDPGSPGKPANILLRDSYIAIDVKFRVEDLDVDHTNNALNTFIPRSITQPGLTLRNFRIHNERGNDTLGSFGFASVESKIAAASGILHEFDDGPMEFVDGQAIYDINVKMDWDLPDIRPGNSTASIGQVFFTDLHINDTSLVISAR